MRQAFPQAQLASPVAFEDKMSAIEFVNRVNWLFETWNVDAMVEAFTPEGVAYHFHGTIRGRDEMRHFFDHDYPYLIPGVSRHATNHIVDQDGEGVAVRYHNLLIRHALPNDAAELGDGQLLESASLPDIWIYSPMLDRLRRVDGEWRIFERYIGGSMTKTGLAPTDTSAEAMAPFMPRAER